MKIHLQKVFFSLVAIWCILCLFLRCGMNLSGLQTGRTLGKGNVENCLSYHWSKTPVLAFYSDDGLELDDAGIGKIQHFETYTQVGLSDKFDLGFSIGFPTTVLGVDDKYQLAKSQESLFSISIGTGVGFNAGRYFMEIPFYFSVHPSKYIVFYLTPKQIIQQGYYFFDEKYVSIRGFNAGVLLGGERLKFGFNGGIFQGNADKMDFNLHTMGLAIKLNLNSSSKKSKSRISTGGRGPLGPNRE